LLKKAETEGREITDEQLEKLTEEILDYHKEILEGLALMNRH
jgi:hypothetical protein